MDCHDDLKKELGVEALPLTASEARHITQQASIQVPEFTRIMQRHGMNSNDIARRSGIALPTLLAGAKKGRMSAKMALILRRVFKLTAKQTALLMLPELEEQFETESEEYSSGFGEK